MHSSRMRTDRLLIGWGGGGGDQVPGGGGGDQVPGGGGGVTKS